MNSDPTLRAIVARIDGEWPRQDIVKLIDEFSARCQQAGYTDTDEVWELLHRIHDTLKAPDEPTLEEKDAQRLRNVEGLEP